MEGRALPNLMIVVPQAIRRTFQQRFQMGLAVHQRQSSQVITVQVKQVEKEEDQRSLTGIGRVLDEAEGRPTIRKNPAKFAVQVGVLRREPSNGLGDGRIFFRPVVASWLGFARCRRRAGRASDIHRALIRAASRGRQARSRPAWRVAALSRRAERPVQPFGG